MYNYINMTRPSSEHIYKYKHNDTRQRSTDYSFHVEAKEDFVVFVKAKGTSHEEDVFEKNVVKAGEKFLINKKSWYYFEPIDHLTDDEYKKLSKAKKDELNQKREDWDPGFLFYTHKGISQWSKKTKSIFKISLTLFLVLFVSYELQGTLKNINIEELTHHVIELLLELLAIFISFYHLIEGIKELWELRKSKKEFIEFIESNPYSITIPHSRSGKVNISKETIFVINYFVESGSVYSKVLRYESGKEPVDIGVKTKNREFSYEPGPKIFRWQYLIDYEVGKKHIGHERIIGKSQLKRDSKHGIYYTCDSSNNYGTSTFFTKEELDIEIKKIMK